MKHVLHLVAGGGREVRDAIGGFCGELVAALQRGETLQGEMFDS